MAAFVLVKLTGSRAVKLLQGMWFNQVDRHSESARCRQFDYDAQSNGFVSAGQEVRGVDEVTWVGR